MNLTVTATLWAVNEVKACGSSCSCGPCGISVGDGVTVNGLRGRGVVTKRNGTRLTIQFRNEQTIVRDQRDVHKI